VQEKSTRQNHRLSQGYPAFPAQWFYGLYAISPVTMLGCHRRPRDAEGIFATLAPASERQDHATSPSAPAPLVAQMNCARRCASIASRSQRP
jgi:hypothetical protein